VLEQCSAGLSWDDAKAPAHQQFCAKSQFHFSDSGRGGCQSQIGALCAMGNAPSFDDVPEQIEVGKIEPHGTSFLFYEGRLRKKHIATGNLGVQASRTMK
jgi:hypothetical protein